jgi:hypothetical protein
LPRSEIIVSHPKQVAEVDQKEALASGQFRPLVRVKDDKVGTLPRASGENDLNTLATGETAHARVRDKLVVLAACSWQRPHLIVLDEPTNYLDRDSLGALSKAEVGAVLLDLLADKGTELTGGEGLLLVNLSDLLGVASGQFRPLVRKEIEQHCANFGLDAELVSHSRMRGRGHRGSHGQGS